MKLDDTSTWVPQLLDAKGPIYLAIADALAADLQTGRLLAGDRLPTHRQLAKALGVNVMTVSRAYAEAGRRGLTEGEVGRGTFVRRRERNTTRFEPGDGTLSRRVDFHFNLPAGDPTLLDATKILRELPSSELDALLHTGYTTTGTYDHRIAGAEWIGRSGLIASPERTLVCGGAQHAMTVTFASLAGPGDVVLTEELTYPGVKALASVLGLRLQGLAMDSEGLLPEAFEAACRKSSPKALYCMPTMQNPTGSVMGKQRRHDVAEVARRFGITIVEDDTYGYLSTDALPPLTSFAPERSFFLTGTSKNLTAGLRIGYLLAPDDGTPSDTRLARLEGNVAALTWMAAPLMAEIASRWIRSGQADAMVAWKRTEALQRRLLFDRLIVDQELPQGLTASHPSSSHLWLSLPRPWRSEEFVTQAARQGVALTGAEAFVVGRASAPHAVRICLGTPPRREQVVEGLTALSTMLAGSPEVSPSIV